MPISLPALQRQGAAAIAGLPVSVRWNGGQPFAASYNEIEGGVEAVPGGLQFVRGGTLLVSVPVWPVPLNSEDQTVTIQQPGGTQFAMRVARVVGSRDPMRPEYLVTVIEATK